MGPVVAAMLALLLAHGPAVGRAQGEPPLLQVSVGPGKIDPHLPQVFVKNVYQQPATAWVVALSYLRENGGAASTWEWWADGVPVSFPGKGIIRPNQTVNYYGSSGMANATGVADVVVLYADGHFAGNPVYLKQLMADRQSFLDELHTALPLYQAAADEGSASAVRDLAAKFEQLSPQFVAAKKNEAAAAGLVQHPPTDPLMNGMEVALLKGIAAEGDAQRVAEMKARVSELQRDIVSLNQSLPRLEQ